RAAPGSFDRAAVLLRAEGWREPDDPGLSDRSDARVLTPVGSRLARPLLHPGDMEAKDRPLQIAVLLYPGVTALDAVGPWEVFSRIPGAEVRFVGKYVGPVQAEGGSLLLGATHTLEETSSPDLVLVPGGATTPSQMVDDEILDWLRRVHETTTWTASVCTGSLILGAAGLLKGRPATTHWWKMSVLKILGARPQH